MVRSPAHPVPFAQVDAKRIAGHTLVIVLHAVVFGALMMPSAWTPPEREAREMVVVPVDITPPELPPLPKPPEPRPVERVVEPSVRPTPVVAPTVPADPAPLVDGGELLAQPGPDAGPVSDSFDPGPISVASLAYDVAPAPRYPRQALRDRAEGTVTLKVLVDESGRPLEVEIETSSGHRALDAAARDQVLARWRFHPAQHQGRAIRAWALVPVVFSLP